MTPLCARGVEVRSPNSGPVVAGQGALQLAAVRNHVGGVTGMDHGDQNHCRVSQRGSHHISGAKFVKTQLEMGLQIKPECRDGLGFFAPVQVSNS
jgi:hypothetical protein